MPPPSTSVTSAFVLLVLGMAALFVSATWRAGRRLGEPPRETAGWTLLSAGVIALVMGLTGIFAARGAFADMRSAPPDIFKAILPTVALTFVLAFSRFGDRLVRGLSLSALIGFQVFRIPVEWVLWALHREGALPIEMTFEGLNFDILTGLSAPIVAWLAHKGRAAPALVATWNTIGLALLVTIVMVTNLSSPLFADVFRAEPRSTLITTAPYIWLPIVLVQAALLGHLLVYRRLRLPR
ncbi:hypothetical protein SAMN05443572_11027 [Myxococcus fulvus]|uniref:Uncharacterized protein n=1 Tax=Myxococcus fulvus TaxID=33 RepID=A0A511T9W0_MYXFU|nr:hypothetical protein [Myxococcus fulvus]GEN10373.1 hypothetical protein MFU01_54100 [Myxococcus fulvus]SEU34270.1 hypothetical protein SAMN05443572_11027 [Myxococcus fulvus]